MSPKGRNNISEARRNVWANADPKAREKLVAQATKALNARWPAHNAEINQTRMAGVLPYLIDPWEAKLFGARK